MSAYPSKILLLGEYTIIQDSCALAIPFHRYQSYWSDEVPAGFQNSMEEAFSKDSLQAILIDLKQLQAIELDLNRFESELQNGLWFCSNSPMGYGLGSSGAVCAAIYGRYGLNKAEELAVLKQELALLEHSFHGKSSGIDPLIAYADAALWVHEDKRIESVQLPKNTGKGAIFLVDTHLPRVSTPLINFFVAQCELADFVHDFVMPAGKAVKTAIVALLAGHFNTVIREIAQISALQYQFLPPMICEHLRPLWRRGLEEGQFYLKICGAGGGGFMLGFCEDWEMVQPALKGFDVLRLY